MSALPRVLLPMLAALWLCGGALRAQDDVYDKMPIRVISSTGDGTVQIDRGARDLLEIGDRVLMFPRAGGTRWGTVRTTAGRTAVVELDDQVAAPEPGTRGEALVPKARRAPPEPEPVPVPVVVPTDETVQPTPNSQDPTTQGSGAQPSTEQAGEPRWQNRDEDWKKGMPLLAEVRPVKPSERPTTWSGRVYSMGALTYVPESDYDNSLFRVGTDVRVDNPFGLGGAVRFDGEIYYRTEFDDDTTTKLLVRQLSYGHGGTRFSKHRWEAGRFLQFGMPEFGFLDGFEYGYRMKDGSRLGASIGFLPTLNQDFRTGDDFQLAGYYHWAQDDRELYTFDIGFQKTWHEGAADRDLFILKGRAVDVAGFELFGSFWVDYYTNGDNLKGPGLDLTQAWASIRKRFDDGSGLELAYRRRSFPEFDREEFLPPLDAQIAGDAADFLNLNGRLIMSERSALQAQVGYWSDEDENGGSADAGIELRDFLFEDDLVNLTGFYTAGRFESLARPARLGRPASSAPSRWDLSYEIANHRFDSRADDGDDLLQHRLLGSTSFYTDSGWTWTLNGQAVIWDEELSWSLGFHVQKQF